MTLCMRTAHLTTQSPIEDTVEVNCPDCGHAMTADPITAAELAAVCLPCAAAQGYAFARALYKNCYGRAWDPARKDDAPEHERATSFRGPVCSHIERPWTPVISVYGNGQKIGRHWIPGFYCEECTRQITIDTFRNAIAERLGAIAPQVRPGETWQLCWAKQEDVRMLFQGNTSYAVNHAENPDFKTMRNG